MIVQELTGYIKKIETFDKDQGQDAQVLHQYLIELTNYMARANNVMADYKRKFRQEKQQAYLKLIASTQSQSKNFAPMLAKDYVDSMCHETGYVYDLAERLSRICTHTIEAVRTIVSSLKSEKQFSY